MTQTTLSSRIVSMRIVYILRQVPDVLVKSEIKLFGWINCRLRTVWSCCFTSLLQKDDCLFLGRKLYRNIVIKLTIPHCGTGEIRTFYD